MRKKLQMGGQKAPILSLWESDPLDWMAAVSQTAYQGYCQNRCRFPFPTVSYFSASRQRFIVRVRRRSFEAGFAKNNPKVRLWIKKVAKRCENSLKGKNKQKGVLQSLVSPWACTALVALWGIGNAVYWEIWKGYPACRYCAFHRNLYMGMGLVLLLALYRKTRWIAVLVVALVGMEWAVSLQQIFSHCAPGLCRKISLPEKGNAMAISMVGMRWIIHGLYWIKTAPIPLRKKNGNLFHFAPLLSAAFSFSYPPHPLIYQHGNRARHGDQKAVSFQPNPHSAISVWRTAPRKKCREAFFAAFLFSVLASGMLQAGQCSGKFLNPISDICWKCIFPIRIAGIKVVGSSMPDPDSPKTPVCLCPPHLPGIPVSFWEPVRLVEVTRKPFCLISLGGVSLGDLSCKGTVNAKQGNSFYHVHWYIYPLFFLLEILTDFLCLEKKYYDLAYITEFDPLWNDDSKTAIINPEALLFGNIIAQTACIADCAKASVSTPIKSLFWCCGCQGSMYPLSGTVGAHNGGVQGSLLIASRMIYKLHRQGLLHGTVGEKALCRPQFSPIINKQQYRLQMTYPIPETKPCKTIGQTEVLWQGGREYPVKGEDFAYLVWRKRDCCLTPF